MTEEEKLKAKEIRKKFALAKGYLKGSQNSLRSGDVRLSTDGAYNAAELIMRAAILSKEETIPKRHGGIAQRFSLLFIKTGELPPGFGGRIKEGLKLRNKARYDEEAEITKEHALHNIKLAEELISFLERELKIRNIQKSDSGLGLIGVLLIIGALVITTGGVLVWQKRVGPTVAPPPTPVPGPLPTPAPSPEPKSTFPTEYSCNTDGDCVIKKRPFCCGESLQYYNWCYHKDAEPETISCKGVRSCLDVIPVTSCVCQNGKCTVIFTETQTDTSNLHQSCGPNDQCPRGQKCISYYGIAGPRGSLIKTCEIPCPNGDSDCPKGFTCFAVSDGPGLVCKKTP